MWRVARAERHSVVIVLITYVLIWFISENDRSAVVVDAGIVRRVSRIVASVS